MNLEQLSAPQSRRAEVAAGILALAAGLFALAFAVWLPVFDPRPSRGTPFVAAIAVGLGVYSLVLARRLLAANRPRYLISPITLGIIGLLLLVSTVIQVVVVGWQGLESGFLGIAALLIAWRRLRLPSQPVPPKKLR